MIFTTSLDKVAKGITLLVTILFSAIIIGQYAFIPAPGKPAPLFITVLLLFIYGITFVLRPIHYEIIPGKIIIRRLILPVEIERSQIQKVVLLDKDKIGWSVRVFGNGGLFGYYGKFANSQLGSMTWYATRRDKPVLVQTIDKKIILTPDEPAQFVAYYHHGENTRP